MCNHPICSGRQTCGRTSRGHTGSRKVTQDFSTFRLRCLPSFLSREAFSRPFHSLTLKSNFVYPRIDCSPLVGHDFIFLFFFVRKSPNSWRTIVLFYAVGTQKSTSRSTREKETAESFSQQKLRVPYTYYSMYFYLLIGEGSGSHRRKVTQDFSTFLQIALEFFREKDPAVLFPRQMA